MAGVEELQEEREEARPRVNLKRMLERVASASPGFIAGSRDETHPEVRDEQTELLSSECSICLEAFNTGQS